MKIFLPDNFVFHLLYEALPQKSRQQVTFFSSSLISNAIKEAESTVGFIPTTDLLFHHNLFVSSIFGAAFEGPLSTTYLYFKSESKKISELILCGDVSSLEPIAAKILFKELYDSDIIIQIETNIEMIQNENSIVCGDFNFSEGLYKQGISIAEEIIELLSLPFVNFVLASKDEKLLNSFQNSLLGISDEIYSLIEDDKFKLPFNDEASGFIKSNIASLVFDFEQNDVDGINQLLQLPYFHGITKEIIDVKFV